jgi:hypothetical protein
VAVEPIWALWWREESLAHAGNRQSMPIKANVGEDNSSVNEKHAHKL